MWFILIMLQRNYNNSTDWAPFGPCGLWGGGEGEVGLSAVFRLAEGGRMRRRGITFDLAHTRSIILRRALGGGRRGRPVDLQEYGCN